MYPSPNNPSPPAAIYLLSPHSSTYPAPTIPVPYNNLLSYPPFRHVPTPSKPHPPNHSVLSVFRVVSPIFRSPRRPASRQPHRFPRPEVPADALPSSTSQYLLRVTFVCQLQSLFSFLFIFFLSLLHYLRLPFTLPFIPVVIFATVPIHLPPLPATFLQNFITPFFFSLLTQTQDSYSYFTHIYIYF